MYTVPLAVGPAGPAGGWAPDTGAARLVPATTEAMATPTENQDHREPACTGASLSSERRRGRIAAQYPWPVCFRAPALIITTQITAATMLSNTINAACLDRRRGESISASPIAHPSGGIATARM
jgi:hypothetical protein